MFQMPVSEGQMHSSKGHREEVIPCVLVPGCGGRAKVLAICEMPSSASMAAAYWDMKPGLPACPYSSSLSVSVIASHCSSAHVEATGVRRGTQPCYG